ncbi:MAG: hypothetical protein R2860_10430 [Desulfobacterales bacterium]
MEIADLFVINKADTPGADEVKADILAMLELSSEAGAPAAAGTPDIRPEKPGHQRHS